MLPNQKNSFIIPSKDLCFPNSDRPCNSALYVAKPYPENTAGIYLDKSLAQFNNQNAEIQFKITNDISGHLILAVQGNFGQDYVSGYYAFIGREYRFPDSGIYICIEKAYRGGNQLLNPVKIGDNLNPNAFYSIKINSIKYQDRIEINAKLFEYSNGSWNLVKETSYTDYSGIITGPYTYFGPAFQDSNVYFDNYVISWS
ncbi:MAG: hypothetical protein V1815_01825 [Candidatus Woesearchaeota archaeon]